MTSISERDRITVKIHNMKRSTSRDSPPPSKAKRGHVSLSRYDDGVDDRMSPERMRRPVARSPSPRPRYVSPHRDEYVRIPRELPSDRGHSYKVLCVSSLHPKASDEFVKETLYREYKKYGDFSIRISHDPDERVAYVCFRQTEDAREAKHDNPRIRLYDKRALVEPVYETARSEHYKYKPRAITPPPEYDRPSYYPPGPPPAERRRPPPPTDPYDRYGPPPHAPMHHHPREFRPPMHHHHEYMAPRGLPMHHHGPPPPHMRHPAPPPYAAHHHHYAPRHMVPRHHAPMQQDNNGGGGGGGGGNMGSSKKDKFPNYLHHVQPEDDPQATRTLFAGNLEVNITDEELRRIFGKYGVCEDIDIKRPQPGTGNAFAFIRFQNLDMAHRAKVELSGQYIGKFQCKIGYGKATPCTRIWVGGLGSWTSVTQLEREFDRFGAIEKIEYIKGDTGAYILYESIEAATEAVKVMRGFALGGPEKRLRLDFAEATNGTVSSTSNKTKAPLSGYDAPVADYHRPEYNNYHDGGGGGSHYDGGYAPRGGYRGRGGGYRGRGGGGAHRGNYHYEPTKPAGDEEWRRVPPEPEYEPRAKRSASREPGVDRSRSRSPRRRSPDSQSDTSSRLGACRTLPEVARKSSTLWTGALILKSSLFPAKFHLTDGDSEIVESLMKNEDGKHHLRITQRLRLDLPKLEDVQKRISTSSAYAIFLGMPGSTSTVYIDDAAIQTRPLRNLVSYLKQKDAAGVLPLLNKSTEATGVLYAFPPCEFSAELLKKTCHNVTEEGLKEDHLVIVVVRGGTTPQE